MINIIENIDPINYIMQDVLTRINGATLEPRNNFYTAEGYSLDVVQTRKNNLRLKVRTSTLQDLCNIQMDKKCFILRFSPELFFLTDKDGMYTSSLFDDCFSLSEFEEVLKRNDSAFGYGIEFDVQNMVQTLELCEKLHKEFIQKISTE